MAHRRLRPDTLRSLAAAGLSWVPAAPIAWYEDAYGTGHSRLDCADAFGPARLVQATVATALGGKPCPSCDRGRSAAQFWALADTASRATKAILTPRTIGGVFSALHARQRLIQAAGICDFHTTWRVSAPYDRAFGWLGRQCRERRRSIETSLAGAGPIIFAHASAQAALHDTFDSAAYFGLYRNGHSPRDAMISWAAAASAQAGQRGRYGAWQRAGGSSLAGGDSLLDELEVSLGRARDETRQSLALLTVGDEASADSAIALAYHPGRVGPGGRILCTIPRPVGRWLHEISEGLASVADLVDHPAAPATAAALHADGGLYRSVRATAAATAAILACEN